MQLTVKVVCIAAVLFAFALAPTMQSSRSFALKPVFIAGDNPKIGSGTG